MFEIGFADDASASVGGTLVVWRLKSIEAEDANMAMGEMIGGRTAHGAEASDDYVKMRGRV